MVNRPNRLPIPPYRELYHKYHEEDRTTVSIGQDYNTSGNTVLKWLRHHEIPVKPRYRTQKIKTLRGGQKFKLCKGPTHNAPTWVPVEQFHPAQLQPYRSQCKACETAKQNHELMVPVTREWIMRVESLVRRFGFMETCRRTGLSTHTIAKVRTGRQKVMRRDTARKILKTLIEARETGEVRHRDSIKHGAHLRGRQERPVTSFKHLLKPHGDSDNEYKRKLREDSEFRERENQKDRNRRQSKSADLTQEQAA